MDDTVLLLLLVISSVFGWFVSTIVGGGSSLILMPAVGVLLGTAAVPPTITIGGLFGNAERAYTYRSRINTEILCWELPGALVGAILGAFTLSQLDLEWLTIVIALFLILSALNSLFKRGDRSFEVKSWYFLPGGFIVNRLKDETMVES